MHFYEQHDYVEYENLMSAIGYTAPPYSQFNHIKKINDKLVYDVNYNIGMLGFRTIPDNLLNKGAPFHFIIAGDSNTFSEGCSDKDSIAAQLSPLLKNYYVYNLGQRGAGPHNMLALMKNYPFEDLIKEKNGIFLYNFFPTYMFERVIGSKSYSGWDHGRSPYYDLDRNGKLIRNGYFKDRTFTSIFYNFLNSFKWLNKLIPNLPRINDHHIEIVTKIFLEMKKEYLFKFPSGKFYIIINNSYQAATHESLGLIKNLKKYKLDYIEVPFNPDFEKGYILKDLHLNKKGQATQTKFIAQEILKKLNQ
ncbi:MAG: hypothetical protein H7177_09080 [Rhizobacter sp.]|nr:hypothetical protein [Bacteriovorax sp.]